MKTARKLIRLRRNYYGYLNRHGRHLAEVLAKGKEGKATKLLLKYIAELYEAANAEKGLIKSRDFEAAYHNPISSELEFLLARTLLRYSRIKNLDWKIYLRRQKNKTSPDVRIERGTKTIAILEVKAKAGWIQPLFSAERYKKDMRRKELGESDFDPAEFIKRAKNQFTKYEKAHKAEGRVFLFLPTLIHVHRKGSKKSISDYMKYFSKKSGLSEDNFILLSENPNLDLANPRKEKYMPTARFERFVKKISKI